MDEHKGNFIKLLLEHRVLEFGNFRLKSGRVSPYMINMGNVDTGGGLTELGLFYAEAIREHIGVDNVDIIYGPAYKGIPLCISTAMRLTTGYKDIRFLFNRKERKKYAEGRDGIRGLVIGEPPNQGDSIVPVDDVFASGQTKFECIDFLTEIAPRATIAGLVVGVDRQEVNKDGEDAVSVFKQRTGVSVHSIVTISDICDHLTSKGLDGQRDSIQMYLNRYGIASVRE